MCGVEVYTLDLFEEVAYILRNRGGADLCQYAARKIVQKKRQAALSDAQCDFLVEEVAAHEDVIRNKINTADMHKKKKRAWEEIAENFRIKYPEASRDVMFFRKKWENMVSLAKNYKVTKRLWDEKRTTGGGPAPTPPPRHILAVAEMYEDSEAFKGVGQPLESAPAGTMAGDASANASAGSGSTSVVSLSGATDSIPSASVSRPPSPLLITVQQPTATNKPASASATLTVSPQLKRKKTDRITELHAEVLLLEKQKLILEKRKIRLECKKLEKEIMLLEENQRAQSALPAFTGGSRLIQPDCTSTAITATAATASATITTPPPGTGVLDTPSAEDEPRFFAL